MKKRTSDLYKKYEQANHVLNLLFALLAGTGWFLRDTKYVYHPIPLLIISLVCTLVSGYVALIHKKLPKEQKEKVHLFAFSSFSIHPYCTFIIFIVANVVFLSGTLDLMLSN